MKPIISTAIATLAISAASVQAQDGDMPFDMVFTADHLIAN